MSRARCIDINCDMGELPDAIADGTQESLMPWLTSVNIACGGHAGDDATMRTTIEQALRWKLAIGAHPGYPDRANFGRVAQQFSEQAVAEFVSGQVLSLARIAAELDTQITHVKPHGALYNQAVSDRKLAAAIARGIASTGLNVVLVGLAGSPMLEAFRSAGFRVAAEAFADRRYEPDGTLRSRKLAGVLIHDPAQAAAQALSIAERGTVIASDGSEVSLAADTLCIHGDTPGAPQIAEAVASALQRAGIALKRLP
jgi:5-oxoprolinase (ATP-hydrolysing) subunit A